MIDVIIPTMWFAENFEKSLEIYTSHSKISRIILIDNNKSKRPNYQVLNHPKIELVSYGRNIFVNPAWNEGYFRSKSSILAIINDDITVDHSVFDMVLDFDIRVGDLIGVNLRGYQNNYKIDDFIDTNEEIVRLDYDSQKPIGSQAWAFGICMFMLRESYNVIPSLYQLWYGDDFFAQKAKRVFAINSNKIKGTISETLVKFNNLDSPVSRRIELDSKNLIAYDHFIKGKHWDIPHNMIRMYEDQRKQAKNVNVFESEYQKAKSTPSDINENLHILYELGQKCDSITEMGVRTGVSTRAFLNTSAKLRSYDIQLHPVVKQLFIVAKNAEKDVEYIEADVLNIEIEETDLLFIDTLHTYNQLKKELALHANKAKKYIVFHDTYTFGLKGEHSIDNKGLMTAIIEFLIDNPQWKFHKHKINNNGLTVLKRAY